MRRERLALKVAALIGAAGLSVACGSSEPPPAATEKIVPQEVGEMSPEEAGGMAPTPEVTGGGHAAAGLPHGGSPVAFGTAAQLELVLDPSSGLLTGYVLDGAGVTTRTTAKTIELEVTPPGGTPTALSLASTANGLTGDTVGNSSQFGGTLPALKGATTFTGVVKSFTVGGQTFSNVSFTYPAK